MTVSREQISDLWPFRPRLIADESFASWFARTAWANGLNAAELYQVALSGGRLFRIDLDRFACDALIDNLSAHTEILIDKLRASSFHFWASRIYDNDDGHKKLIWLPPAGLKRDGTSFGQQACPRCLSEADTPFLKRKWRLSFVAACDIHKRLLIDRCPACASPIQPLLSSVSLGSVATCWNCNFDLRNAVTPHVDDVSDQECLLAIAQQGWGEMGSYGSVHAISYFRILWTIYRLLSTGRFALALRNWLGASEPSTSIPRIKEIERLNPRCRHTLVSMAYDLIQDWPDRFLAACKDAGINSFAILKDEATQRAMPFALWEPVSFVLSNPVHKAHPSDIRAAKEYLRAHKARPTYRALQNLLGLHFHTHRDMALPARKHVPYGTYRYWKLDDVSPEIRAAAKKAAHKQGENVGAWVDNALRQTLELLGEEI